jgi:predicted RNA-binding protein (virulence factor B family)
MMTENTTNRELTPEESVEYLTKLLIATRERLYATMALNIDLEVRLDSAHNYIKSKGIEPMVSNS